jgi:hypothetical protein
VRYLIVAETYRDPEFARVNLHLAERLAVRAVAAAGTDAAQVAALVRGTGDLGQAAELLLAPVAGSGGRAASLRRFRNQSQTRCQRPKIPPDSAASRPGRRCACLAAGSGVASAGQGQSRLSAST